MYILRCLPIVDMTLVNKYYYYYIGLLVSEEEIKSDKISPLPLGRSPKKMLTYNRLVPAVLYSLDKLTLKI